LLPPYANTVETTDAFPVIYEQIVEAYASLFFFLGRHFYQYVETYVFLPPSYMMSERCGEYTHYKSGFYGMYTSSCSTSFTEAKGGKPPCGLNVQFGF